MPVAKTIQSPPHKLANDTIMTACRPVPLHRLLTVFLTLAVLVTLTGCAATPSPSAIPYMPQTLTLQSKTSLLALPDTLTFTHGLCIPTGRHTVAMAAGDDHLLLADLTGPNNRCELLLRRDGHTLLYERIGQRPLAQHAAKRIPSPVGTNAAASVIPPHIITSVDIHLQPSERWPLTPFTQRFPRHLRLTGKLRLNQKKPDAPAAKMVLNTTTLLTDTPGHLLINATSILPTLKQIPLPSIPSLSLYAPPTVIPTHNTHADTADGAN